MKVMLHIDRRTDEAMLINHMYFYKKKGWRKLGEQMSETGRGGRR